MGYNIGPVLSVGGEAEYNAAMRRVNESMKYVSAEANAATSAFDRNDKSVAALTAQINGAKSAMEVHKQAIKASEDALERMRANGVDPASTAYKRIEANLNNAKAALNRTDNEVKSLEQDMKKGGNEANTFGSKIKAFASSSIGQFVSVAGAIALAKQALQALWEMVDNATNAADELLTLEQQTGLTVDTLQEMQYAARFVDVELEQMTTGLSRTVKAIREANTAGKDYIEIANGSTISIKDQSGQLRDSEDVFYNVIDAIGNLANETERETAAQKIFGKSYQDIMPLVNAGSDAIKGYGKEAKDTGKIIDTITVKALGKLDDKLEGVAATVEANKTKIAAGTIQLTDTISTAWSDLSSILTLIQSRELYSGLWKVTFEGMSGDAAAAAVKTETAIRNVAYITKMSADEVKLKADELSQYLIGQGVDSSEAYYDALVYIANGFDTVSLAQKNLTDEITKAYEKYTETSDKYLNALSSKTKEILKEMGGVFDEFPKKAEKSADELISTMETKLNDTAGWLLDLDTLIARGVDEGIVQELRDLGPKAAGEIDTLANMTQSELLKWVDLYEQQGKLASAAAVKELAPMAEEVKLALQKVEKAITAEEEGMKEVGRQLGYGIGDGIDESTWYIEDAAVKAIKAAVKAAEDAGKIQSPSKLTRDEVGFELGRGVGVGFVGGIEHMIPDMSIGLSSAMKSLDIRPSLSVSQMGQNTPPVRSGGDVFNVTIDAKNVKEINDIVAIAKNARQTKRAG